MLDRAVEGIINEKMVCGAHEEGFHPGEPDKGGCGVRDFRVEEYPLTEGCPLLAVCKRCGWRIFIAFKNLKGAN